jgi:NAD(P)-dependent dehydrogenase (short-subunit alcohol dehydrogenase family)
MASEVPVAIVTGGSRGMGMSIVRDLIQRGWKVAVADINEDKAFTEELGDKVTFHTCNVADYDK